VTQARELSNGMHVRVRPGVKAPCTQPSRPRSCAGTCSSRWPHPSRRALRRVRASLPTSPPAPPRTNAFARECGGGRWTLRRGGAIPGALPQSCRGANTGTWQGLRVQTVVNGEEGGALAVDIELTGVGILHGRPPALHCTRKVSAGAPPANASHHPVNRPVRSNLRFG